LLSAAYADNFQTGDKASRIFSFGFNYKFLDENKYKEQLKVSSLPYRSTVRGSGPIKKLPAYVKDPDSNQYKTIAVGDQVWMAKNLKTGHYCDGTKIPGVDDITSKNGRLYTWNDVNHSGKLCPAGWHVPSHTEWISLFNSLSGKKGEASILAKIFNGGAPTGQWWSSTEQDAEQAQSIYLNSQTVGIMFVNSAKTSGFSVRCIRDH
jgi:hypothetical protein